MKKLLSFILVAVMLSVACFAADDVTVKLNGEVVDCAAYGQPATIVEGRTLVPLRAIFEALGATVEWDQATKTVSSELDGTSIKLTIGENTLYKNGEGVTLDVPAMIMNGRTLVPARAIAEAYGVGVEWDAATRTVILTKEEKVEEPAEPELAEGTFFVLTGENYTGDEGYRFLAGTTVEPQIVENPDDASDKVVFIHSEFTEKASWTYFRNSVGVEFKPGERYLVKFKARLEKRADDMEIPEASVGICFRFGDSTEDGTFKDHGVGGSIKVFNDKWTEVAFVYTAPETLLPEVGSEFGIFGNPNNNVAISFYLDDVSLAIYDGAAADGFHTAESFEEAEAKADFDINNVKGLVYDLNEDNGEFRITGSTPEYKDGHLVMTSEGETQIDPIINFIDVSGISADEYGAVAVRFKAEGVAPKQDHICVYFSTVTDDQLSQSKCVKVDYKNIEVDSEGYYVAFIGMITNENWNGQLTALRVDPGNSNGIYTIDKIAVVEK